MNSPSTQERFEWLDAGRALGDLTPDEEAEWKALAETHGQEGGIKEASDIPLDAIVATLEQNLSPADPLPEGLKDQIRVGARDFHQVEQEGPEKTIVRPSFWSRPAIGWAAAAVLAILFLLQGIVGPRSGENDPLPLVEQVGKDPDLLRREFLQTDPASSPAGEVLWSDSQQQGVMLLAGLPENDPSVSQYQLWIVDPTRDDVHPVDGGVFDIPATGSGPIAIPISAKLRITNPAAFVITMEQPGGVVVSKQEQVVAIAKS